jgi:hypothetical protein
MCIEDTDTVWKTRINLRRDIDVYIYYVARMHTERVETQ